jgi:hypothetical protein
MIGDWRLIFGPVSVACRGVMRGWVFIREYGGENEDKQRRKTGPFEKHALGQDL